MVTRASRVRVDVSSSLRTSDALLSAAFLTELASKTLLETKTKSGLYVIDVRFVGNARIKKLNSEFRKKDVVTDVLSFSQAETKNGRSHFPSFVDETLLGDIFVCIPQARKQAKQKMCSVRFEVSWLFVHGLLHLLGFDHVMKKDAKAMRTFEQHILSAFFPKKDLSAIV